MAHHIEVAASGRATCQTCEKRIEKDTLRPGEEYASQVGDDGLAVRRYHLGWAADALPEQCARRWPATTARSPTAQRQRRSVPP